MNALPIALLSLLLPVIPAVQGRPAAKNRTPAELAVARARKGIEGFPGRPEPWNQLALALARRARETAKPSFYDEAKAALAKSFDLAPRNFEGRKVQVWVSLGQHEFARALAGAKVLNRRAPDDVLVYGLVADAAAELGKYDEAEEAVQWMLDLRPGNVPGLTRAAYLREIFGDLDGALDLMVQAFEQISPSEAEDRAWVLTQVGHLHRSRGDLENAEKALEGALGLFPEYHYALAEVARVREAQGRAGDALAFRRRHYEAAPHPENLFELAVALDRAGEEEEAATAFGRFEREAREEMETADNANRELIAFYVDHARSKDFGEEEGLRIARREASLRRDIHTLDALAWALHANGEPAEAKRQIEAALAVGTRDAGILEHARAIGADIQARSASYSPAR